MRDAFSSALKLLLAVFLLAVGVAALDLRVIQPFRTPPCNPETLEEGHVCLSQVLKEWPGKILWIDARKQDDFERHTVTRAPVYPIRPADANYQELLANAMEALMTAEDRGFCIVIFCSRDCTSSAAVANELKKPEYGIRAPIFILEGGWDELRKPACTASLSFTWIMRPLRKNPWPCWTPSAITTIRKTPMCTAAPTT